MSDRHPKWQRVEPGTVIPAGQPYRVENEDGYHNEYPGRPFADVYYDRDELMTGLFVDSSWTPPLDLPTEPTWGIAVHVDAAGEVNSTHNTAKWWLSDAGQVLRRDTRIGVSVDRVLDFIPLTPEQVARIEAAR
jgi:hypothetical protein